MTLCEPSDEQEKQSAELSSSNCRKKPEYYNLKEAFVESERKFRTLVENVPDNIVRHDLQGRVLYINPQLEQTLGQCAQALLGKTIGACYPDGRFDDYQDEVENVIRTGQNSEIELTLPDNGEGWRYLYIRLIPEREADGKTLGVLAIGRDITDLKRVELELQSNLRYFEDMDRINRAIQGSNDLDTMMRDVLDTVLSIFACDRAYLLYPSDPEASSWHVPMERHRPEYPGVHALGLAMPMDEGAAKVFRILLDAGRPVKFGPVGDYPLSLNVPEDLGIKSLMSVAVFPKVDKPWHFGLHQCSYPRVWTAAEERLMQEIGRRLADGLTSLLAYRDMRERELHFRTLAKNSPDNIARYDLQGRMIYSNSRFDRTLGLFVQESSTNPLKGGNADERYQEYQSIVETVISTGRSNEMELSIPDNEGGLRYYNIRFAAECGPNGEIIGALAIGRNITELKATERYLEESRAQLRALTAKREKADEEERKRIGREIHDELGQLLSVMRLNVTTLDFRYGDSNPDLRDKVQKIVSILDRTIAKVRNLATRLRPVMLNFGIISALAWLVKDYAESTGIVCELHVSVEDIPLDEDRAIVVFRIVQESLTNILRHSGAKHVVISLRNEAGICEVDVQDNGKGFDPADAGKRDSHGIIGMRERALMLNGTLDIVPAKTGGTVLKLRIPIERQQLEGGAAAGPEQAYQRSSL